MKNSASILRVVTDTDPVLDQMLRNSKGKPLACLQNALVTLRHDTAWSGVLAFDESKLQVVTQALPPFECSRQVPFVWRDDDDVKAAAYLQRNGVMVGKEVAGQAVYAIARERSFHPVRDYLNPLKWDGIDRLYDWPVIYLGVDPAECSAYVRAVGGKWLIGAVARIYEPGCKCDCCLILEGPQGTLKSTALKTLGGPFFTDDMPELGTKDASMQNRGVWIIELSELDAMTRTEVSRIKSFMSRPIDRFRPPYGRHPIDAPRECVFAGTVNHDSYLKDETGARRFWPLKCGVIDIESLKRDRDQLWAEAVHRYREGETWWIDSPELSAAAAQQQQDRYDADAWQSTIEDFIREREDITSDQVLGSCLEKPTKDWTQSDKNRVAKVLKSLGWEKFQKRTGNGDEREYRYRPAKVGWGGSNGVGL